MTELKPFELKTGQKNGQIAITQMERKEIGVWWILSCYYTGYAVRKPVYFLLKGAIFYGI